MIFLMKILMHFLSRIVDLSKAIKTLYHHTLYYSIEYSEIRGNHMVTLSCKSKKIILRAHFFLGLTLVFLIVSANVSNNMERKKVYSTEEALNIILAPIYDSELSDIEFTDDEDEVPLAALIPRLGDDIENQDVIENQEEEQEDNVDENEVVNQKEIMDISKFLQCQPRWRNKSPPVTNAEFSGDFDQAPDDCDTWTPSTYFKLFWKDDLNVLLAEQTNLYSVQRNSSSINTNSNEISQLIGLQMYMSVISLPCYRMYWARETRYSPIADVIPVNRYKLLHQNLHVVDSKKDDPENTQN